MRHKQGIAKVNDVSQTRGYWQVCLWSDESDYKAGESPEAVVREYSKPNNNRLKDLIDQLQTDMAR